MNFNGRRSASCIHAAFFLPLLIGLPAAAQLPDLAFPVANGDIHSLAVAGNTLYLAGSFSGVGPATGGGCALDAATGGALDGSSRLVDGQVYVCIPDASGGFYIGGRFSSVGGHPRTNLAHVRADRSLDPWSPNVALTNEVSEVDALALSGTTLYIAGGFTSVGGQPRGGLGALDVGTGSATPWEPQPDGRVTALAISATGDVLVGGYFTHVGGASRNRLAALDAASGAATSWDPNLDAEADAIAATPSAIYIGGGFHHVGADTRNFLAAVDPVSGAATPWDPNAGSYVLTIATGGSTVYVGGSFQSIHGQARYGVAAIDAASGLPTVWNPASLPNYGGNVESVATDGSTVYVGGAFPVLGGQSRAGLAAVDAISGSITAWDPSPGKEVRSVCVSGTMIYVGGAFTMVGLAPRRGFAAIDIPSRQLLPWNPQTNTDASNGQVTVSGSTVYLAGGFTAVGGLARNGLAAVDAVTAQVTAWDPGFFLPGPQPPAMWAMRATPGAVFVCGNFCGSCGSHIAALNPVNGQILWRDDVDNNAYALALDGSTIYAGGAFNLVNGIARVRLVALDPANGQVQPWNPSADGDVLALALSGSTLFVGGQFSRIGVVYENRARIAALDTGTGLATTLNPGADNGVGTLLADGYNLYLGGAFEHAGGEPRPGAAAVDVNSGQVASWSTDFGTGGPLSIVVSGSRILIGGNFSRVSGLICPNLVSLEGFANPASVPVPAGTAVALRALPNPAANGLTVALDLRDAAVVRLEVLDVSGRRHVERDMGRLASGQHLVPLAARGELPPGLYFVLARRGTEAASVRVCVTR
jgi:hypothetical protein